MIDVVSNRKKLQAQELALAYMRPKVFINLIGDISFRTKSFTLLQVAERDHEDKELGTYVSQVLRAPS